MGWCTLGDDVPEAVSCGVVGVVCWEEEGR